MKNGFMSQNWTDAEGRPAGGVASGTGFTISWQNGPLGRDKDRQAPNGAFVEDVIAAAMRRIAFYQQGQFACEENAKALLCLAEAAEHLDSRTKRREQAGTEGTHEES